MAINYGMAFKFPFTGKNLIKKFLIGSLSTIIFPLGFGYFIKTYREIITSTDEGLPEWDDPVPISAHGIIMTLIILIYFGPSLFLTGGGYLLLIKSNGMVTSGGVISFPAMCIFIAIFTGIILFLLSAFIFPMAVACYADKLDLKETVNISFIIKKIFDNFEAYVGALIIYGCVYTALFLILFFIFPALIFYMNMFYAHIFGQIYGRSE